MKHVYLIIITIIVNVSLYGCTTVNFLKTDKTYPPYNGDVTILYMPLEGTNYEVVGVLTVDGLWDTQEDLVKLMQKVAAQNGANAIVMCSKNNLQLLTQDSRLVAPVIKILPSAQRIAATPPPVPQSIPIEKIVPPTPAPVSSKTEKAIVEKGRATLNIQFDTNKAVVKDEYIEELAEFADVMKKYPNLNVVIEGHTDNVGNNDFNTMLSQKRAESVKNFLVTKFEIDSSHLDAKGYGETRPIADNNTMEGRQMNRRVEAAVDYEKTVK